VGVLAVLGIGIAIFALKGKSSGDGNETIILPSSAPTTVVVASDTPTTTAATSDSAAPASSGNAGGSTTSTGQTSGGSTSPTTGSGSGTKVDAAGDKACDAAIAMGLGGNTMLAISQYRSCTGPKRSKALSAIDSSALREVKAKGCAAKPAADAAAGVGASSGKNALPKTCR
jgi:hypothetical protein